MEKHYHHLKEVDRIFLRTMYNKNYPKNLIAKILGVHRSTIYRELKRNSSIHWHSGIKFYDSYLAQDRYIKRRTRPPKLVQDNKLRSYVYEKLKCGWSPWQIEGRMKYENNKNCMISHETIYRHIYSDYGIHNRFYWKLRRQHFLRIKRNLRRKRIPENMLITSRPTFINNREEFGHWERDLMIFKRGVVANFITLRERKTRYMLAIKNQNKSASGTALALISTTTKIKEYIKSITFDRGTEFYNHKWVRECIGADIYFCEPASPHQKGAVENGNGVIRLNFPRSYDIGKTSQGNINKVINEINNRPLKCLSYLTPFEVFEEAKKQLRGY